MSLPVQVKRNLMAAIFNILKWSFFFSYFDIKCFALLLLYVTWCTMLRLYFPFLNCNQHLENFTEI